MTASGREYQFAGSDSGHSATTTPTAQVSWAATNAEQSLVAPPGVRLIAAEAAAQPPSPSGRTQAEVILSKLSDGLDG